MRAVPFSMLAIFGRMRTARASLLALGTLLVVACSEAPLAPATPQSATHHSEPAHIAREVAVSPDSSAQDTVAANGVVQIGWRSR
jgi:hypothetical protein